MAKIPLAPLLEVPDENTIAPLTPDTPAFTVEILMAPLVVATPVPVFNESEPPVRGRLSPLWTITFPPATVVPLPIWKTRDPPAPPVAAPVNIENKPVLPELDVPEENRIAPLTPRLPAFADIIEMDPLLDTTP
jgi:hypothetical protein